MIAPKVRKYGPFLGADFTSVTPESTRCPYMRNMWKDYNSQNGIALETRPGFRQISAITAETGEAATAIRSFENPQRKILNLEIPDDGNLTYYLTNEHDGYEIRISKAGTYSLVTLMAPKYNINDENADVNGKDIFVLVRLNSGVTMYMVKNSASAITAVGAGVYAVYGLNTNIDSTTLPLTPVYIKLNSLSAEFEESGKYILTNKNVYMRSNWTYSTAFAKVTTATNPVYFSFNGDEYIIDSGNGIKRLIYNVAYDIEPFIPTYAVYDNTGVTEGVYQPLNWLSNKYALEFAHNSDDENDGTFEYAILNPYGSTTRIDISRVLYNGALVDAEDYTFAETESGGVYSYGITFDASVGFVDSTVIYVELEYIDVLATLYNPILKCTKTAIFENKVFFIGNAEEPNTYYWSALDDVTYIPNTNFEHCGIKGNPIQELLPKDEFLYIFKEKGVEESALWYATELSTGLEEIAYTYPNFPLRSGTGCLGQVFRYGGEPVFMSAEGLKSINRKYIYNEDFDIEHRSTNVDGKMLKENLENVKFTQWRGYLFALFPETGNIYVADNRTRAKSAKGDYEYEWFLWTDIGLYAGQDEIIVYDDAEETIVRYRYMDGGTFYGATTINADGDTLYICASDGTNIVLCQFNTDVLREDGMLQEIAYADGGAISYALQSDLSYKWVASVKSGKPLYGRPILSGFSTIRDNVGTYSLIKTLGKKGFCMYMKSFIRSGCKVRYKVAGNTSWQEISDEISTSFYDFETVDFSDTSFNLDDRVIIRLKKKVKKFDDISFLIYNDIVNKPFGIYEMQAEIFYGGYGK